MTAEELAAADVETAIVVLDRGIRSKNGGQACWAYIAVCPSKYEAFLDVIKSGQPKIYRDYGVVLRYGTGETVPAEIREEMKREYGFDDNFIAKLEQEVRAEQAQFIKLKENRRIDAIVALLKKKQ